MTESTPEILKKEKPAQRRTRALRLKTKIDSITLDSLASQSIQRLNSNLMKEEEASVQSEATPKTLMKTLADFVDPQDVVRLKLANTYLKADLKTKNRQIEDLCHRLLSNNVPSSYSTQELYKLATQGKSHRRLDFTFLFASPRKLQLTKPPYVEDYSPIDYIREWDFFKKSLTE